MAVTEDYKVFIIDQLSRFPEVQSKRMFGGIGLFKEGLMFGMIGGDIFRLKVDESNQADFEKYDMKPYQSKSKKKGMPYWEVPLEIIEDKEKLAVWALKSYEIAIKNKTK